MKRTLENCSLIARQVRRGEGKPRQHDGQCLGYGRGYQDDEPCEVCKKCPLQEEYAEEAK